LIESAPRIEPDARDSSGPRASVIITFFNQGQWVKQTLDSVASQTERNIQLSITDDGSSDNTRVEVESWLENHLTEATFVASNGNLGLPAMLNRAIPSIHGPYVVILNGDDLTAPHRIAHQAQTLDAVPIKVGIVSSDIREVDIDGVPTGRVFPL
jgi:glycosyltransferase involved in cell wall biosynthesis